MKKVKKLVVSVLTVALLLAGAICIGTSMKEAKAESTVAATLETGAVVLSSADVTVTGSVPKASISAYEDYLFAGWFSDKECTLEHALESTSGVATYYAKFVPADTMNVKVQISENEVTGPDGSTKVRAIRCISSVESLELSRVGFEIDGKIYYVTNNQVFERIESSIDDFADYEFSPKVVGTKSEYFVSANLPIATDDDSLAKPHTITSVWETIDGTVVKGTTRSVAVNDGASNIINMTLQGELVEGDESATVSGVTADKVEVLEVSNGYSNVRITLPAGTSVINMKSATEIIVTGSESTSATGIYRNYYTTYGNGGADTSWYDVDESATEFVIASDADMWGLASLVTGNKNSLFANDKVILVRDVTLIKGQVQPATETTEASWVSAATGSEATQWSGIGSHSGKNDTKYPFKGSFDGDNNTISGVYMSESGQGTGLFNYINGSGTIENFVIRNSYITGALRTGAVCGDFIGYLDNVYVDTDVVIKGKGQTGGVVGFFGNGARTIKGAWFAGTVSALGSTQSVGGIAGATYSSTKTIENCLVTGEITSEHTTDARLGGILGYAWGNISIVDCISMPTIDTESTGSVGTVVGYAAAGYTVALSNIYADDDLLMTEKDSTVIATGKQNVLTEDEFKNNEIKYHTALDFVTKENPNGIWAATADGPKLAAFAAKEEVLDDVVTRKYAKEWYYNAWTQDSGDVYELATALDLYGFAAICNDVDDEELFVGDTVCLVADIDLNPGWSPQVNSYGTLQNVPTNMWEPIGTTFAADGVTNIASTTTFKGIFDGKRHEISGIYVSKAVRDTGLFGCTGSTSQIKNIYITDSYFMDTAGKGYVGSIAGTCSSSLIENVTVDDTVVIKAEGGNVGGIAGLAASNTTKNILKCWFAGKIWAKGSSVAGILGISNTGTNILENCLFTGWVKNSVANKTRIGGIVGGGATATKTTIRDCVSVGELVVLSTTNVSADIGQVDASKTVIEDVYSANRISHSTDSSIAFAVTEGVTAVNYDDVKADARTVLSNVFTDANGNDVSCWGIDTEGLPVIRWREDGTLQILLIGNSFCYYHTDELYGMLEAAGIEASVTNVYDSGCTVAEHVSFLNNNTQKYDFITYSKNGKTKESGKTLKACLVAEEWDVISLQQHFDPSEAMDYTTASEITLSYAKTLYDYLKANYPNARLLWQQTWAYQVGYKGYGDNDFSSSAPDRCVLDEDKQTLNYENIRDVAKAVCSANNVERVPNGDAWQLARAVVGDILCDKTGSDLAADTHKSDCYHDGDEGGGQFLNACGWYEVITGLDCRDNTYVPSYEFLVNTGFNEELTTQEDVIAALKEAAHTAVLNVNQ